MMTARQREDASKFEVILLVKIVVNYSRIKFIHGTVSRMSYTLFVEYTKLVCHDFTRNRKLKTGIIRNNKFDVRIRTLMLSKLRLILICSLILDCKVN